VITLDNEEKRSFIFKICCHFRLRIRVNCKCKLYCLSKQIATETVLVETAVQKQVNNKIQEATFHKSPIPAVTLSVKSKMSYHVMAGALEKKEC
jgi:hypothetical protein